jgi:probable O-glycosylation ligase (exosortase A-associated)
VKQTVLMVALTAVGVGGVWLAEPFWGVAIYYLFAVLRPQFLWEWSLPVGVAWSRYVALSCLAGLVAHKLGLFSFPTLQQADSDERPRLGAGHWCALAFGGWLVLSYVFGPYYNPMWSDDLMMEYAKIFIMFVVAAHITTRFSQVWGLFLLTALTLAYISYEMNDLYFNAGYLAIYRRGFGGLDNNGAALMLGMGAPMCLFLWEALSRWYRWLFLLLIPAIIHAVLMSYSRGAMLSLIVVCPLLWWRSRRKAQLALIFAGVACLLPYLAGKEIQARFFSIEQNEVDDSANARRASWAAAFGMANDYPVFGVGLRGANMLSHQYGADMEGRTIHSQYFQIAADNGWVGLALYALMFFVCWRSLRRAQRLTRSRTDPEGRRAYAVACGVEGALAVFCFGATFLSLEVFELPYLLLFLAAQLPTVQGVAPPPEGRGEADDDAADEGRPWREAEDDAALAHQTTDG